MLSFSTPEYAVLKIVSAISSAMDSKVFLKSSKPIGSESRVATVQTSITILPETSSAALAPGGGDNPQIVLLTPGPGSETFFEQALLAGELGCAHFARFMPARMLGFGAFALFLALGVEALPETGQARILLIEFHIPILTEDNADKFLVHEMVAQGLGCLLGNSIALALEIAKVKHVVNLSSIGAELSGGTGPVKGLHNMEERLNKIKGLNVLHLRASYFMENLLWSIDLIRSKGINGNATRGDLKIPMIATRDIAAYAADRLVRRDFWGSSFQELLGPRGISLIEATEIIGRKIGKPGLSYLMFPYDEAEKGMIAMGLSPDMSRQYIEMNRAFNDGRIKLEASTSQISTTTSFEEFCNEVFVPLYTQKKAA